MLAAVFEGNGKLSLKERSKPILQNDIDVLIKVSAVGICGTDLHILQVPAAHPATIGAILGHEFTGEIVEVGKQVFDFKVGDTVIVDPHPGCGVCRQCKIGRPDRCERLYSSNFPGQPQTIGIFSDGAMTSYVTVPAHSLYKISKEVPSYIAALAEPLSCVVNAASKVKVQPGDNVVILGAGPIGLLFTCMFKASGASKIIVSETSEYRRKIASECGATIVVNPNNEDLRNVAKKETNGGADIVVEAVGPLLNECINLVRAGGEIIQFGHNELVRPEIQVAEIVRKEVTIHGAYIGKFSFDKTARIMESGILPLDKLVSHRLPLSRIHEGIELLRKGKGIKVIIYPENN